MNPLRVEINRLHLSLEDVPQSTVAEAMEGLGGELRSRLMRVRLTGTQEMAVEVDRVAVVASAERLDAASLRTMIVERLAEQIERASTDGPSADKEKQ